MDRDKTRYVAGAIIVLAFAWLMLTGRFPGTTAPSGHSSSWDSTAIQAQFAGIKVREVDPQNATVLFSFDLENTTDSDYQLAKGPNLVIMSRLKSNDSFSPDQQISLNSSIFVPAKNRTRITLEIHRPFGWPAQANAAADARFRELVAEQVGDVDGFVLFDKTTRFQINLPAGWPELRSVSQASVGH